MASSPNVDGWSSDKAQFFNDLRGGRKANLPVGDLIHLKLQLALNHGSQVRVRVRSPGNSGSWAGVAAIPG